MATYPATDTLAQQSLSGVHPSVLVAGLLRAAIAPLASLRLTVVLFALAIGIVMIGTLGQTEMDIWSVMSHYFYRWLAWVPVRIFFPPAWFSEMPANNMKVIFAFLTVLSTPLAALMVYQLLRGNWAAGPLAIATMALGLWTATTSVMYGAFFFPGGKAIGVAMVVNLLAAHAIRFTVQARGARLGAGILVIAVGIVATWFVIVSGHNPAGLQGVPFFEKWAHLWWVVKIALTASVAAAVAATIYMACRGHFRRVEFWIIVALLPPLVRLAVWLNWPGNDAYLGDSGMRILWQLIKALLAALVLLAGCQLLFKRRGGIVLLHGGVLLLMFGQVFVSQFDVEEQITIAEGQTVNYAHDIRAMELAVIDSDVPGDNKQDSVIAIPLVSNGNESRFLAAKKIQHDALPFDIEIEEYFHNSVAEPTRTKDLLQRATQGNGLSFRIRQVARNTGTESGGEVDQASAYVTFVDKTSGSHLGTCLLSQCNFDLRTRKYFEIDEESIKIGDKSYTVALRFRRQYKPYNVTLVDVRKDDYLGSSTVRNYSSDIFLIDEARDIERKPHISMNNPLRYAGETFYQSRWFVDHQGRESTGLSVVTNRGWMIPYVACMIVATGLLAHFTIVLLRFLNRLASPAAVTNRQQPGQAGSIHTADFGKKKAKKQKAQRADESTRSSRGSYAPTLAAALAVVLVGAYWVSRAARPVQRPSTEMQFEQFGRLPVIYRGRIKPLDTLARNSLRAVSNREVFTDTKGAKQPAIRWLLDVITDSAAAREHQVFRIDNLEVLDILELNRRPGSKYSINEIGPRILEFEREVMKARKIAKEEGSEKLSVFQKKLVELDGRVRTFTLLNEAFVPPNLPPLPTIEEVQQDEQAAKTKAFEFRQRYQQFMNSIQSREAPLVVPQPKSPRDTSDVEWLPYSQAWASSFVDVRLLKQQPPEALSILNTILVAYRQNDVQRFNGEVANYLRFLEQNPPAEYAGAPVDFEVFFNHLAPFYNCSILYVLVFILTALAWLTAPMGWHRPLNWAAFCLVLLIFAVHTYAVVARIQISGRPPVTNLYGSAIFIGWGCVLLGLILEWIFRIGVGNMVAAVSGFSTLLVAHFLADGDTMAVLQAVLDTQFWLATHVVTVTLGYATTYVAGLLGIFYILAGVLSPALRERVGKMTYGRAGALFGIARIPAKMENWTVAKTLTTMIYGTLCFSIFFSFVGTVLGGLWADDSWGRFWGWDPKENGALIIVLWNALVLHARWGAVVKDRGLAMLVVAGNIAVSWSWFGVNELGIGLHSYGFTEGVLMWLGIFVASQLAVIALACLPKKLWLSFREG